MWHQDDGLRCARCQQASNCRVFIDTERWLCEDCDTRRHYRWWTCSGGRSRGMDPGWLKLGPLSLAWFQWDGWHLEAHFNLRQLFCVPRLK